MWKRNGGRKKERKEIGGLLGWKNPFHVFCPQQQVPIICKSKSFPLTCSNFLVSSLNLTIKRLVRLVAHSNSNQSASQAVSLVSVQCRPRKPYCQSFPASEPSCGTLSAVLSVSNKRSNRPSPYTKKRWIEGVTCEGM